jgi:hypothetical protein
MEAAQIQQFHQKTLECLELIQTNLRIENEIAEEFEPWMAI